MASIKIIYIRFPMTKNNQHLPIYSVNVFNNNKFLVTAQLSEASKDEVFLANKVLGFECNWLSLWEYSDFDYEAIIKLSFNGNLMGLARISLYSDSDDNRIFNYLEIRNLECVRNFNRSINPVGLWLIWYCTRIAFDYCTPNPDEDRIVILDSLADSIDYYRDKVRMQEIGWTYSAPGEDCYAFKFTEEGGQDFLSRMQQQYGDPILQS
jgi:hypothetical protein